MQSGVADHECSDLHVEKRIKAKHSGLNWQAIHVIISSVAALGIGQGSSVGRAAD